MSKDGFSHSHVFHFLILPRNLQYGTIAIGGIAYALYASWKTTLVVLAVLPILCISALAVMKLNQTRTSRANEATSKASGLAYAAISNLRTVLSLNAVNYVITCYREATQEALEIVASVLWKPALANGSMAASFTFQQAILALYGTSLLYHQVAATGCNPAGSALDSGACPDSGASIFGAMIGTSCLACVALCLVVLYTYRDTHRSHFRLLSTLSTVHFRCFLCRSWSEQVGNLL